MGLDGKRSSHMQRMLLFQNSRGRGLERVVRSANRDTGTTRQNEHPFYEKIWEMATMRTFGIAPANHPQPH